MCLAALQALLYWRRWRGGSRWRRESLGGGCGGGEEGGCITGVTASLWLRPATRASLHSAPSFQCTLPRSYHYHHRIIILSSSFRHCIIILIILSSFCHHCVIIINFPLLLQFLAQQNSITMTMVTLSIIMNTVTMLLKIPVMELLMMTCMEEIRRGDGGCSGASQRIFTDLKSTGYWNCVLRTATGTGYCVLVNIHVQEV